MLLTLGIVCAAGLHGQTPGVSLGQLESEFQTPPASAKPYLWWHWMNGNVSREGVTKDLEAMKSVGVGGVVLFEEFDRIPQGSIRYASAEHFSLIRFAADECQRLGLDFGFHNGPGWSSSGGPWITPEHAMKNTIWSEVRAKGGGTQIIKLPCPPAAVGEYRSQGHTYQDYDWYRDVVVIAFPTPKNADARLDGWKQKALLTVPVKYGVQEQEHPVGKDATVEKDNIIVITQSPNARDEVECSLPDGDWTILRMGYILTGHWNQQGPTTGGRGLDCDKMSREAVDFHWEHFVDKVVKASRGGDSKALSTVLIDSYETDVQTWTPRMPEEFQRLRGYSLIEYLPCLTGRIVNSVAETERFLWDFRRTIAELVGENYYGHFANRCREVGLKASYEGYGYNGIFDDFDVSRHADIPMSEFWAGIYKYSAYSAKVAASAADMSGRHLVGAEAYTSGGNEAAWMWHPGTLKAQGDYYLTQGVTRFYIQASAHQPWADHIRPGMTMGPHGIQMNRNNTWWSQSRAWLSYLSRAQAMLQHGMRVADVAYYYGENQPATLRTKPHTTRDRLGVPRDPDADMSPDTWFEFPEGHDFHVFSQKALLELSVNARGQITHPHGACHELLVIPHDTRMCLPTLRKLAELVRAGATVVGPKPSRSPSLADGMDADRAIQTLADQMWGGIDGENIKENAYGKGMVFHGLSPEEVLRKKNIIRDFGFEPLMADRGKSPRLSYIHRTTPEADFYFISNQRDERAAACVFFRQHGVAPEIWNPETGEIKPAPIWSGTKDGRTSITLNLEPAESCFVVFPKIKRTVFRHVAALERNGASVLDRGVARVVSQADRMKLVTFAAGDYTVLAEDNGNRPQIFKVEALRKPLFLSHNWKVSFPIKGGNVQENFARLDSWTEHGNEQIKYYSGTATYIRAFNLPEDAMTPDTIVEIDLGRVEVIAELMVNGKDLGVLWKPPYRRDITRMLKPGKNQISVKVTNLWRNRLIGDAFVRGYDRKAKVAAMRKSPYEVPDWVREGAADPEPKASSFTVYPFLSSGETLVESGLLGPVRLLFGRETDIAH
jgi:hypothetical protein